MDLDDHDRKILRLLQANAAQTVQEIADRVGLSATPVNRRIKRMEEAGLIRARVALIDQEGLGLRATLFIFVKTSRHDADWLERFSEGVARLPEVIEFYRMSGEVDYLIKVALPEIADYDGLLQEAHRDSPVV